MFDARALTDFAQATLAKAGLPDEPAASMARGLVEADLLGHTHARALALLRTMSRRSSKAAWNQRPAERGPERGAARRGMRAGCRHLDHPAGDRDAVERARRLGWARCAQALAPHRLPCCVLEEPARHGMPCSSSRPIRASRRWHRLVA